MLDLGVRWFSITIDSIPKAKLIKLTKLILPAFEYIEYGAR